MVTKYSTQQIPDEHDETLKNLLYYLRIRVSI